VSLAMCMHIDLSAGSSGSSGGGDSSTVIIAVVGEWQLSGYV
jgi:hypothetical protein